MALGVMWSWMSPYGWAFFNPTHQQTLEQVYQVNRQEEVELRDEYVIFRLNFSSMTARDAVNNCSRALRREINLPMIMWLWKSSAGAYKRFDPTIENQLETEYLNKTNQGILLWSSYEIDVDRFTQKNIMTGRIRPVYRVNSHSQNQFYLPAGSTTPDIRSIPSTSASATQPPNSGTAPRPVEVGRVQCRGTRASLDPMIASACYEVFSSSHQQDNNEHTAAESHRPSDEHPRTLSPSSHDEPRLKSRKLCDGSAAPALGVNNPGPCSSEEDKRDCPICLDELDITKGNLARLKNCGHLYHEQCISTCIVQLANTIGGEVTCPVCKTHIYMGLGGCPKGTMDWQIFSPGDPPGPLAGHPSEGTILIHYYIRSGTQTSHHPSPGSPFHGTKRIAFLPDCREGRLALLLLVRAFRQGLTFTIGRSQTLGRENMVIWNGLHHKTQTSGGAANHGFPDDQYIRRLMDELKSKGIQPSPEEQRDPWVTNSGPSEILRQLTVTVPSSSRFHSAAMDAVTVASSSRFHSAAMDEENSDDSDHDDDDDDDDEDGVYW